MGEGGVQSLDRTQEGWEGGGSVQSLGLCVEWLRCVCTLVKYGKCVFIRVCSVRVVCVCVGMLCMVVCICCVM